MCGKRPFTSVRQARIANRSNHKRLRGYWCRECKAYHMTSQTKNRWMR